MKYRYFKTKNEKYWRGISGKKDAWEVLLQNKWTSVNPQLWTPDGAVEGISDIIEFTEEDFILEMI